MNSFFILPFLLIDPTYVYVVEKQNYSDYIHTRRWVIDLNMRSWTYNEYRTTVNSEVRKPERIGRLTSNEVSILKLTLRKWGPALKRLGQEKSHNHSYRVMTENGNYYLYGIPARTDKLIWNNIMRYNREAEAYARIIHYVQTLTDK